MKHFDTLAFKCDLKESLKKVDVPNYDSFLRNLRKCVRQACSKQEESYQPTVNHTFLKL